MAPAKRHNNVCCDIRLLINSSDVTPIPARAGTHHGAEQVVQRKWQRDRTFTKRRGVFSGKFFFAERGILASFTNRAGCRSGHTHSCLDSNPAESDDNSVVSLRSARRCCYASTQPDHARSQSLCYPFNAIVSRLERRTSDRRASKAVPCVGNIKIDR